MAPFNLLDRLYGRLGRFYPSAFLAAELTTAFVVTAGAVGLIALWYGPTFLQFLLLLGICEGLTLFGVLAGFVQTRRRLLPVREWLRGERGTEHSTRAWDVAVHLPVYVMHRALPIQVLGVALPASIAAVAVGELSWTAGFPIFAGALVAVGYAAILHTFALEIGMRPVVVNIDRHLPRSVQKPAMRFPLKLKLLAALPLINIITGLVVAALTSGGESGTGLGLSVLIAIGVAFTVSLELTLLLSNSIMRPLGELRRGMERVRRGDYETYVPVTTSDEIGELSMGFNQMVEGLTERNRLREAFGTYLDREVADYILSTGFQTEGVEVEATVMFCDVQNFTRFAAEAEANEVVAELNELFEAVVPVISRHGGHIDKFVGDGVMAVFGPPEGYRDHADRALAAAIEAGATVREGRAGALRIGIGINSGRVIAGNIGGGGRLNFSVIGDPVNVAARIEEATRKFDSPVLLTESTRGHLTGEPGLESLGEIAVRGRSQPVEVYRPTAVPAAHAPSEAGRGAAREHARSPDRSR